MLDAAYAISLVVTMWATALVLGMAVSPAAIGRSLADRGLVARLVLLDVVGVPLVMLGFVAVLVPDQATANGLLLVAFASAGPLGVKLAQVAGGDVALAIGAVIVLEAANAIVVPAWSAVLLQGAGGPVIGEIARTLGLLIIAPLIVGGLLRRWTPAVAGRMRGPLRRVSDVGLVLVIAFALARYLPEVTAIVLAGPGIAAALAIVVVIALGWLVGGPGRDTRTTVSLVTGVRANAAALAVATTAFAATPATEAAVVVFALYSVFIPAGVALVLQRRGAASTRGDEPSGAVGEVPQGARDGA